MNKNGKIITAFVANNKNKIRFEAIATLHKKSSSESHSHIPQQLGWVGKCTGLQVAEQQMLWVFRPRQCTGNGKKSAAMACDLHQIKCDLWHTSDVACACPRRHYAAAASGLGDGCVGWALCCRVPNGNMRCVQSTNHVCGLPLEISYKYLVVVLFS